MHYLSMKSVQRFLRPRAIYVLANCMPIGYWWSRVLSDIKVIRFVYRPKPRITAGKIVWTSHLSDVIRLQVLLGRCCCIIVKLFFWFGYCFTPTDTEAY
jgi:hypothetical protein